MFLSGDRKNIAAAAEIDPGRAAEERDEAEKYLGKGWDKDRPNKFASIQSLKELDGILRGLAQQREKKPEEIVDLFARMAQLGRPEMMQQAQAMAKQYGVGG